jgi:coenzyme F420-dependent glucose-6-phosphate dehydrogenase
MPDVQIGYHASHEQFPPSELLEHVVSAEAAGFDAAMCSDHFAPWSADQGHSGFAWSWLGAALARTSLSFGTVCAPGQRYHPAIIAQAAATLSEMFPDRFWVSLGSGEAVNESITGAAWPSNADRDARLLESVEVMRALFRGETVDHKGLVTVQEAKLWTRPATPPLLFGAALAPETARWIAGWADGMITISQPPEKLRPVIDAFRDASGGSKPIYLQSKVSWAPTREAALGEAHHQWRTAIVGGTVLADLRSVAALDAVGATVRPEDMDGPVRVSADPGQHAAWLAEDIELGFERIYVHQVGRDQQGFIEAYGADVLPHVAAGPGRRHAKVAIGTAG